MGRVAVTHVSSGSLVPGLSQLLFSAADRNGDQKISSDEFAAFLSKFVGEVTGRNSTGDLGSAATAVVAAPLASSLASTADYTEIPGFDFGKLTDLTHVNAKYTPAVRAFSMAIKAASLPPASSSLSSIVSYARGNGFPNARVAGSDTIDFGDGAGPIDVITDVGGPGAHWWFNNQP